MKSLCLEGLAAVELGVFGVFVKGHAKLFHDAAGTFVSYCKGAGNCTNFVFALGVLYNAFNCFRGVSVVPVVISKVVADTPYINIFMIIKATATDELAC